MPQGSLELSQCVTLLLPVSAAKRKQRPPTDATSEKKNPFMCRSRGHGQTSSWFLFYFILIRRTWSILEQ